MRSLGISRLPCLLSALVVAVSLAGCGAMEVKKEVIESANAVRKGPEAMPQRSITNFSAALTCMDDLLIVYGVRDVSTLLEDISDQSKKVNAGTKDMLTSAVSDMNKRSRAVRIVAYGQDVGSLIGLIQQSGRKSVYAVLPQYDIKGSISQLDENVAKKVVGGGGALGTFFSIGASKTGAVSVLGLDLSMIGTQDISEIPGVTSHNSVIVYTEGEGVDTDATIKKFSINYTMSLNRSEGRAQALRTLVELASIELFGKLTKVPYWTCLGASPDNPEVSREIQDWYYAMFANSPEIVAYFQNQLRLRRYYDGPIDGAPNIGLRDAVANYRAALGLSAEPKINLEFFTAYLSANHQAVLAKSPAPSLASASAAKAVDTKPLKISLSTANNARKFRRGELISLVVKPSRDAHVYCYLRDKTQRIQRVYPNRFNQDSLVQAEKPLALPGAMRFQLVANDTGLREKYACFAMERDVSSDLPSTVTGTDFENLPIASIDQVRAAFNAASRGKMAEGYFNVEFK